MTIDSRILERLGLRADRAAIYGPQFSAVLPEHGIDTPLREAHFVAQVLHESGMCRYTRENLNYNADALYRVFRKYFPNMALARQYERQPERIGARVYANRMGNGDEASGDGYHYRGRGLIQLTGKNNYRAFSEWSGADALDDPRCVAEEYPVASAVFFWEANDLNRFADKDSLRQLTKAINGGYNGLEHRQELYNKARELLLGSDEADDEDGSLYRVSASRLNLRSSPVVSAGNVIGSLSNGEQVRQLDEAGQPDWVHIQALDGGAEGYVSSRYLLRA